VVEQERRRQAQRIRNPAARLEIMRREMAKKKKMIFEVGTIMNVYDDALCYSYCVS